MENFKIVIFILAVLISLSALINKIKIPHPIFMVVAGLIIGFIPALPNLALDPEIIFLIFLPPLLYDAAFRSSWHDIKKDIRPISALAITLVFFTTIAVAVTAHYCIPGFSWPLAFVLGAVVSPPDAVAASRIIKGLGLDRKVITILEGESLVNDASALIAYRYAVMAVTTGTFIFWKAGLQFLLVAGAGILIGIVIGYLFVLAHKKIEDNAVVETSLTLLTPFISYLAAEQFHVSGVLAVVSSGLVISWKSHEVFSYQTRMRGRVVWDTVIFLLEGFIFILIGLQLPSIINDLGNYPLPEIIGYGLLISMTTIMVRFFWVFAGAWWMGGATGKGKKTEGLPLQVVPDNTWKNVMVIAWTGTRGVISLAAALALPLVLADGSLFPKRHSIIFLAFVVIFFTLVVQGLSLPLLIRWLKIKPQANAGLEERELQLYFAVNTLHFIEQELSVQLDRQSELQLKSKYEKLVYDLTKEIRRHKKAKWYEVPVQIVPTSALFDAQSAIYKFQRELLLKLHKEGEFSDMAIKSAERGMDIGEMQLNQLIPKDIDKGIA